jgi:hypothetical protein
VSVIMVLRLAAEGSPSLSPRPRKSKRSEAMPAYITVYNWFQLIHLPFSIASLALAAGGFDAIGNLVEPIGYAAYVVYLFYLSRSFLHLESHAAAAFVAADPAISLCRYRQWLLYTLGTSIL